MKLRLCFRLLCFFASPLLGFFALLRRKVRCALQGRPDRAAPMAPSRTRTELYNNNNNSETATLRDRHHCHHRHHHLPFAARQTPLLRGNNAVYHGTSQGALPRLRLPLTVYIKHNSIVPYCISLKDGKRFFMSVLYRFCNSAEVTEYLYVSL